MSKNLNRIKHQNFEIPNAKSVAFECLSKEEYSGDLAYLEDLHKEKILKNAGYEYARIWSQN